MTITVSRMRASLLWTWTGAELLASDTGPSAYWAADRDRYVATFDALRSAAPAPHEVKLPWDGAPLQRFWSYYTSKFGQEPKHQRDISATVAYRHLMPFRARPLLTPVEGPDGVNPTLEAFLLPVGIGIALNLDIVGERALDDAVDLWVRLNSDAVYDVQGLPTLTAKGLRDALRQLLHAQPEVPEVQDRIGSSEPFSLVTVMCASGVDPQQALPPDLPTHRAIYGLASRSATWRTNPLPSWVASVTTPSSQRPANQACFATPQGRCVWQPSAFLAHDDPKRRKGLNCYHRNLAFGALQVQTLTHYLRLMKARRATGTKASVSAEDLAGFASGVLGRLYGKAAYHSGSVRRWIDDEPGAKTLISDERLSRGMAALP